MQAGPDAVEEDDQPSDDELQSFNESDEDREDQEDGSGGEEQDQLER